MKVLTIANAHSEHRPTEEVEVELQGGSPWFGYTWIDDVCYTVFKGERSVRVERTKLGA